VRALARLVLGQRLRGVDVAERRVLGDERLGHRDAVALGQHGGQRLDLHLAEAGQRLEVRAQLLGRTGLGPHARRVPAMDVGHVRGQRAHARGHRAREAMDRGALAEQRLEVHAGQRGGVERARALLEHERSRERLLHGHLLVEREADQQRERLAHQQRVGLVGVGEVQAVDHDGDRR
jgi:hypothetical protein